MRTRKMRSIAPRRYTTLSQTADEVLLLFGRLLGGIVRLMRPRHGQSTSLRSFHRLKPAVPVKRALASRASGSTRRSGEYPHSVETQSVEKRQYRTTSKSRDSNVGGRVGLPVLRPADGCRCCGLGASLASSISFLVVSLECVWPGLLPCFFFRFCFCKGSNPRTAIFR